jgi:prolyl oligopeptidase
MKHLLVVIMIGGLGGCASHSQGVVDPGLSYPQTFKGTTVETLHGEAIADPYRWLEKGESPEVAEWVKAQNKVTFDYLGDISARDSIRNRLTELWNYERFGSPVKRAGRYFFTRNAGLQAQDVYWVSEGLGDKARVLIDPNALSKDATTSIKHYQVSPEGKYVAYGVSVGGSDWVEIRVRDVATGEDLQDRIEWVKFSRAAWHPSGSGFYYSRYDAPTNDGKLQAVNAFPKVYFHRLGESQGDDRLVYERKDQKEWGFGAHMTDDSAYVILGVWKGTSRKNGLFYKKAVKEGGTENEKFVELLSKFDAKYRFLGNSGSQFYFHTDLDAPMGRIISIDVNEPERSAWKELVPESKEAIQDARLLGGHFVVEYLSDARSVVKVFALSGSPKTTLKLPGLGSVSSLSGKATETEFFFRFSSFAHPPTIFRYDLADDKLSVFRRASVVDGLDDYVVTQQFYASPDGTKIPIFLAHKKGVKLDGTNPTYLYGYGGFNIAITPYYSTTARVWMEMGGVYAVANIRGGGEYGRDWHLAGTLHQKQNVFDDFIAAAEWLVKEGYTTSSKLAIGGRSNGGLLVGACMTQRPELFGAALPGVGVLDMLRFHKFTIGWAWVSDYGSPDKEADFKALRAYSPLHNLKAGTSYPATMVTTADHDDRVVPAHSFKFAAALQEAHGGGAPVLIRIDTKSGHGAGRSTNKRIEEATDSWGFLYKTLKMTLPQGFK